MRIIPVLDVKAGRAVHAVAGDRAHYGPLRSVLHEGSDPIELARAYREVLGLNELYVADLDAIAGGAPNVALYRALSGEEMSAGRGFLRTRLYADAGIRDAAETPAVVDSGVSDVILGLETLRGPTALREVVCRVDPTRLAFSLDLRAGLPVIADDSWTTHDPRRLAEIAVRAGVRQLILLDLARVGTGMGTGVLPLLVTLRADHPATAIIVGGGIAGPRDLVSLEQAGASAVLIGSALHDGRIDSEVCLAVGTRRR